MGMTIHLREMREIVIFDCGLSYNYTMLIPNEGETEWFWNPSSANIKTAEQYAKPLKQLLKQLQRYPKLYQQKANKYNWDVPPGSCIDYQYLVHFIEKLLYQCRDNPKAKIISHR